MYRDSGFWSGKTGSSGHNYYDRNVLCERHIIVLADSYISPHIICIHGPLTMYKLSPDNVHVQYCVHCEEL